MYINENYKVKLYFVGKHAHVFYHGIKSRKSYIDLPVVRRLNETSTGRVDKCC